MGVGDPSHHESDEHSDGVGHDEAGTGDGVGVVKRLISADRGDGIKNGSGQHVGEGARDRETVFDEAADDGDDGAFTNGENRAEQSAHQNRESAILWKPALKGILRKICAEESTDDSAEENKREAFEEDRKELEGGVLKLRFEFLVHSLIKIEIPEVSLAVGEGLSSFFNACLFCGRSPSVGACSDLDAAL